MTVIDSQVNRLLADYQQNQAVMDSLVDELRQKAGEVALGGGEKSRQKHLDRVID